MRTIPAVMVSIGLMIAPSGALAAETGPTGESGKPKVRAKSIGEIVIEARTAEPGVVSPTKSPSEQVSRLPQSYSYWDLEWFGTNSFCLRRRSTTNAAVARGAENAKWYKAFAAANGGAQFAQCLAKTPAPPTPAQVADDRARSFWDVRVLPDPVPKVVPDYAITGKLVYLQIAGPKDQRFDVGNPIGDDVAITATSSYAIDWGDGSTTRTASQGGPWPDGDVTHAYTSTAKSATITVTQLWSARWTAGRAAGDLGDLRTTATLTLPVTQLQAVRNS